MTAQRLHQALAILLKYNYPAPLEVYGSFDGEITIATSLELVLSPEDTHLMTELGFQLHNNGIWQEVLQ